MVDTHPGDAERLHRYWVHGEGAARIRWGEPGDFDRCTRQLEEHAHFTPEQAHGYCNLAHHAALGIYPATHAKLEHGRSTRMAKYSADQMRQMAAKGQAMKQGDNISYPIADVEDLQNAIHAVGRGGADHDTIRKHIISRARALGKSNMIPDNWNSDGSLKTADAGSSRAAVAYTRSYGLEDISIRAGDGRTVDAYAAVFDLPTPIRDQDGEYDEIIDRSAFNSAIANAAPSGGRERWRVGVFYNHGRTIWNTPSDLYSMPVGVPLEIRADARGLFTRTKYLPGQLGDTVIDAIREGSISGYSFSGAFTRSDPGRGPYRADRAGRRTTVRRMESTLREYGPTPFPAYADASIVGMRAEQAAMLLSSMPADEFDRFRAMFAAVTSTVQDPDLPTPGGVTEAEPPRPAARSIKEEMQARSARFLIEQGERNA